MPEQNQNPIDAVLSQAPAPNPIDLAIFNAGPTRPINGQAALANPIDAAKLRKGILERYRRADSGAL